MVMQTAEEKVKVRGYQPDTDNYFDPGMNS